MDIGETLTRKYGPLPGYAWVGIGGVGVAVLAKLGGKKNSAPGNVTLTPATDGSLSGSNEGGGGGGGGYSDPYGGLGYNPSLLMPQFLYAYPAMPRVAPIAAAPRVQAPTAIQTITLPGHDPYIDQNVPADMTPVASPAGSLVPSTWAAETHTGLFTGPVGTTGTYQPGPDAVTTLMDSTGHSTSSKGTRVGGAIMA